MLFDIIAFSWFLNFGYVPLQDIGLNQQIESIPFEYIATDAELGLKFRYQDLTVYGSIENYQYIGTGKSSGYFLPYRVDYEIVLSLKIIDGVFISLSHECDHPVVFNQNHALTSSFLSSETKLMIRIEGGTQ